MGQKFTVVYEATPNPNALRYLVGAQIAQDTVNFTDPTKTSRSPLAQKLFGFPWAAGVMIGPDFITVVKQDWVDWKMIADPLGSLIEEHLESGAAVLYEGLPDAVTGDVSGSNYGSSSNGIPNASSDGAMSTADYGSSNNRVLETDSATVKQIKTMLNELIRPAVAMDGGDVAFVKFEADTGRLFLQLQGSCSGCPSSMITLKDGIEVRLKEEVPGLTEVISI